MTPLVVGVMLTADREAMTRRAIASFEAQTYERKCLLVLDSGRVPLNLPTTIRQIYARIEPDPPTNVGHLRNIANAMAGGADIIAHFDSDDYSHPRRLGEQVALLQASGADCVGYNEILFWDTTGDSLHSHKWTGCQQGGCPSDAGSYEWVRYCEVCGMEDTCEDPIPRCPGAGEAWIYENDALDLSVTGLNPGYENSYPPVGASYCYWRKAWERLPFPEIDKGEDTHWKRMGARCYGVSGFPGDCTALGGLIRVPCKPRIICEIHGANTSSSIQRGFSEFRRTAEWDAYCAYRMDMEVASALPKV